MGCYQWYLMWRVPTGKREGLAEWVGLPHEEWPLIFPLMELESMVSYCALGSLKGWLPQDLTWWVSVGVHFLAFCTVSAYWFLQFSLVYLLCYAQSQALPTDLTVKTGSGGIISSLGVSSHFPSIHQQRKQTAHQHQVDNLSLLLLFFFF